VSNIQADHQQGHNQFVRGRLESRNTFPTGPQVYSATGNGHRSQSLHSHATTLSGEWPYVGMTQNTATEAMPMAPPTKSKAFSCPLLTCSRMFKTMEYLKRHLKTHRTSGTHRYAQGLGDDGSLDDGINADAEDGDEYDTFTDLQQCEVEVQGPLHDVQGNEEGLVTNNPMSYIPNGTGSVPLVGTHDAYYPGSNNSTMHYPVSSSPEPGSYGADPSSSASWAARSASTPSFNSVSIPSPQARMSSVGSVAAYNSMGECMTSMSAPSQKATFDHGSIYPSYLRGMSSGPGPVRRHRSVTPSVAHYGESIRRPYSAAMTDLPAANNRSYHPYAVSSGSHSSSAQSSPGSYHIPLDYGSAFPGQIPASLARSGSGSRPGSSHLQEQMSQMLNLDSMETESMGYTSESSGNGYGGIYRTDSPASFANSSAPYVAAADGSTGQQMAEDSSSIYGLHYGSQSSVDHSFYAQGHPQSVPM
jgi:transcription factor STE12